MLKAKPKQTEKQFMGAVVRFARLHGWRCYHTYDSRKCVPGFPDLTLVRNGRLVFAELKRDGKAKATEAQRDWLHALAAVKHDSGGAVRVFLWTPENWAQIEQVLG